MRRLAVVAFCLNIIYDLACLQTKDISYRHGTKVARRLDIERAKHCLTSLFTFFGGRL